MTAPSGQASGASAIPAQSPARFRERRWVGSVLALGDVFALEVSFALGYLLRLAAARWYPAGLGPAQLRGIALGLLLLPVAHLLAGLYPGYGLHPIERLRLRMKTSFTVFATLIVWDYLIQHGDWSRGVLLGAAFLSLVLPVAVESLLIRRLMSKGYWGTPVLVLGTTRGGFGVAEKLRKQEYLGLSPALNIDESDLHGPAMKDALEDLARTIRIAVVAIPNLGPRQLASLIETLPFPRVIVVDVFSALQSQWVTPVDLGGTLGLELKRNLLLRRNRSLKRMLDLAIGLPLFLVSVPLVAAFGLWIRKASPGPAFYVQERQGYGGKTIRVWKLRTMYLNADAQLADWMDRNPQQRLEWERCFKLRDDPRILPGIGKVLRRFSLDELPQFWNVLVGDMSLVGPRPFPFYHLERFDAEFCDLRNQVRPGITGLWQVNERSEGDLKTQESLDTYYVRNWSIWMDIHILASTLRAVIKGTGAY
jgi:Undecaprenyl-phosphate galactose phosphotransferase WbaP